MHVLLVVTLLALLVRGAVVGAARRGKTASKAASKPSLAVHLYDFEPCKDVSPNHLLIKNFTTERERSGLMYFNAEVLTNRDLKFVSKVELTTTRCVDAVSYNTCAYLNTFRFTTGVCGILASDSMPWSTVIKAIHPSFRCPINAGKYQLQNGTINMAAIEKLAGPAMSEVLGSIYLPEFRAYNEKSQLFTCFKFKAAFKTTVPVA